VANMQRRKALAKKAGPVKRVHVNQAIIRSNRKGGKNDPALTVQTSAGPIRARSVSFGAGARLVQRAKPLPCGARVFIETRGALELA
jgi:hypothetical protein